MVKARGMANRNKGAWDDSVLLRREVSGYAERYPGRGGLTEEVIAGDTTGNVRSNAKDTREF